jgi:hypothetical protein
VSVGADSGGNKVRGTADAAFHAPPRIVLADAGSRYGTFSRMAIRFDT